MLFCLDNFINEPQRDKTNKMICAPSEDSDQPGHPVFAVRLKSTWSSAQWRLWSDWIDAQADLSLRWAHMSFCWFCRAAAQILLLLNGDVLLYFNFTYKQKSMFVDIISGAKYTGQHKSSAERYK